MPRQPDNEISLTNSYSRIGTDRKPQRRTSCRVGLAIISYSIQNVTLATSEITMSRYCPIYWFVQD